MTVLCSFKYTGCRKNRRASLPADGPATRIDRHAPSITIPSLVTHLSPLRGARILGTFGETSRCHCRALVRLVCEAARRARVNPKNAEAGSSAARRGRHWRESARGVSSAVQSAQRVPARELVERVEWKMPSVPAEPRAVSSQSGLDNTGSYDLKSRLREDHREMHMRAGARVR